MFSRISNSEATNFLNEYLLWFIFQLVNWDRDCFGPIRNLSSFSTVQTEKNSWKKFVNQIGESIWWIRYWPAESVGERWRKLAIIFLTLHHASGSTFYGTEYANRLESLMNLSSTCIWAASRPRWICAYKAGYKYKRYCIINNMQVMYVLLYILNLYLVAITNILLTRKYVWSFRQLQFSNSWLGNHNGKKLRGQ